MRYGPPRRRHHVPRATYHVPAGADTRVRPYIEINRATRHEPQLQATSYKPRAACFKLGAICNRTCSPYLQLLTPRPLLPFQLLHRLFPGGLEAGQFPAQVVFGGGYFPVIVRAEAGISGTGVQGLQLLVQFLYLGF